MKHLKLFENFLKMENIINEAKKSEKEKSIQKKFEEYKKTNKLIEWNSFHTLMGKIDMKDAGKIWDKYKKSIANSDGKKSTIRKITDKYKKRIESLGGHVK